MSNNDSADRGGGGVARLLVDSAIITTAIFAVHLTSLLFPHVSHDDYALWHIDDRTCCTSHVHTIINVVLARPLGALLLNLHSFWIYDSGDVLAARMVSILVCGLTATIFSVFLRRMQVDRVVALSAAIAVFTVPGWYFYVLTLCYFAFWMAPAVAVIALAYGLHGRNGDLWDPAAGRPRYRAAGRQLAVIVPCLLVLFYFYQTTPLYLLAYTAAYVVFSADGPGRKAVVVARDAVALMVTAAAYFVSWSLVVRPAIMAISPRIRPYLDPAGDYMRNHGDIRLPPLNLATLERKWDMIRAIFVKAMAFADVSAVPDRRLAAWTAGLVAAAFCLRWVVVRARTGRQPLELLLAPVVLVGLAALASIALIVSPIFDGAGGPYRTVVGASSIGALAAIWAMTTIGGALGSLVGRAKLGAAAGAVLVAAYACVAAARTIHDHAFSNYIEVTYLKQALSAAWAHDGEISGIHIIRQGNDIDHMSLVGRRVLGGQFFHPRTSVPKGSFVAIRYALREIGYPTQGLTQVAESVNDPTHVIFQDDTSPCERFFAELGDVIINMNKLAYAQGVPGLRPDFVRDEEWVVRVAAFREGFKRIRDHTMVQLNNAFDAKAYTYWKGDGRVFLWMDYGRPVNGSAVRLDVPHLRDMPQRLSVRASLDGVAWSTVLDVPRERIATLGNPPTIEVPMISSAPARYFVVDLGRDGGPAFTIGELRIVDDLQKKIGKPVLGDWRPRCD